MWKKLVKQKDREKINVCFGIDDNYAQHCAVTIASILMNSDSFFHIYILHTDLSPESRNKLVSLTKVKKFEISFVKIPSETFDRCYVPSNTHFSVATYFRLVIPSSLPNQKRVIYLDSDVIVNRDLADLWAVSLGNSYIGACNVLRYKENWKRLKFSCGRPYINAGVMVLNIKKMRDDGIEDKFFELIEKYPGKLENVDQDVINLVIGGINGGIKLLKQNWNTEIRSDVNYNKEYIKIVEDPYIIHYVANEKPWNSESKQLYKEKYWEYNNYLQERTQNRFGNWCSRLFGR